MWCLLAICSTAKASVPAQSGGAAPKPLAKPKAKAETRGRKARDLDQELDALMTDFLDSSGSAPLWWGTESSTACKKLEALSAVAFYSLAPQ